MMRDTASIDRVIAFVTDETQSLRDDRTFDIHASSLRKHRLLLDLSYAPTAKTPEDRIRTLKAALDENRTELQAHLHVARTVADVALRLVREDAEDGTYARTGPR